MRIRTTYTPTDATTKPFNLRNNYTLTDLSNLVSGLSAAGVQSDDALRFEVDGEGFLSITTERSV